MLKQESSGRSFLLNCFRKNHDFLLTFVRPLIIFDYNLRIQVQKPNQSVIILRFPFFLFISKYKIC